MTEERNMNEQEVIDAAVEEVTAKKDSFMNKAKKALTSDLAKDIYKTILLGVIQGTVAKVAYNSLSEIDDDDVVEIGD